VPTAPPQSVLMPAKTSHSNIAAKHVCAYARALANVSEEVLRNPTNQKLARAFRELLPYASWQVLDFVAQSSPHRGAPGETTAPPNSNRTTE
jgi:hypothetical protein